MKIKDRFKEVLSWVVVGCITGVVLNLSYLFVSAVNQPWAWLLTVGLISSGIYKLLDD